MESESAENLESLFALLEEMTLVKRKIRESQSYAWMDTLKKKVIWFLLGAVVFIIVLVAVFFLGPSEIQAFVVSAPLIALVAGKVYESWRERKEPFAAILEHMKLDLLDDAGYLVRLQDHGKKSLEYALVYYRHRWNIFDQNVALFSGDLRRLGLFPSLTVTVLGALTLSKDAVNPYLWMPLILSVCFYFVALYAFDQRERPQQVIDLLELAIRHVESKEAL